MKLESVKWPANKDTKKKWNIINKDKNNKRRKSVIENYTDEEYAIFREKINRNRRDRLRKDPLYKLKCNISNRLNKALKKINESKSSTKSIETIGCDIFYLKEYLEKLFESWMTWDNYGKYNGDFNYGWDIDHIIPLSSAKSKEDIIILNHYTNLQPLCSKINRDIKKDKL